MVALIQSKNHAANKGKTAGRYQFDTHPTRIGLNKVLLLLQDLEKTSLLLMSINPIPVGWVSN